MILEPPGRPRRRGPTVLPVGQPHTSEHIAVLDLSQVVFSQVGPPEDPNSKLLARIDVAVAGCSMHLEAYRVQNRPIESLIPDDEATVQECDGPEEIQHHYAELSEAIGVCGPWETVEIEGREYVLIMTPYCT